MGENIVGIGKQHIIHTNRTKEGGSFTVAHNTKDIIAGSIGHLLAVPTIHLPLLTFDSMFQNPNKEVAETLARRYKDVPWKGDVLVRVGHASLIGDIARSIASDKDMKDAPPRWLRTLMLPSTMIATVFTKMFRIDNYNPFTNTVSVFHANDAVGTGRIGQAQFYDTLQSPAVKSVIAFAQTIPFVPLWTEWNSYSNAMKRFETDTQRKKALKIYEPHWGFLLNMNILGSVPYLGPAALPSALMYSGSFLVGSLAAGHITSRFPNLRVSDRYERFGYVFEGKEPKKEKKFFHGPAVKAIAKEVVHKPVVSSHEKKNLGDHQVYESTARAIRPIHGSSARNLF